MNNRLPDQNPRVLIFSGVRGDTRRYRTIHLWEQSRLLGYDSQLTHLTNPGLHAQVGEHWDFVILHRVAYDGYVEALIKRARGMGACILCDVDDLVFDTSAFPYIDSPDFADPLRKTLYLETMKRFRKTMEVVDGITASTDFLGKVASEFGKPVWIHRNAFNFEMLRQSQAALSKVQKDKDKVIIGYASGTLTHNQDFSMIKPALMEIMKAFPQVDLQMIGPLDPGSDWGQPAARIQRLPLVPWRSLPNGLARFDINLAPLVLDNPFSQSKSEIKYMEAALVRIPTVASPTNAFCHAIREGQNGFLAYTSQSWVEALRGLVVDPGLRARIGEAALQDTMERYHPVARAGNFHSILQEAAGIFLKSSLPSFDPEEIARAGRLRAEFDEWVPADLELDPSNRELGLYSLRHRSVITLAKQVWIFLRRLIAPIFPYSKQ